MNLRISIPDIMWSDIAFAPKDGRIIYVADDDGNVRQGYNPATITLGENHALDAKVVWPDLHGRDELRRRRRRR